jgi:hypothetical protein
MVKSKVQSVVTEKNGKIILYVPILMQNLWYKILKKAVPTGSDEQINYILYVFICAQIIFWNKLVRSAVENWLKTYDIQMKKHTKRRQSELPLAATLYER